MPQVFSSVKEAVAGMQCRTSCALLLCDNCQCSSVKKDTITMNIKLLDSPEAEEVDISQYTQDDLECLRYDDPFLYYSIPQVKRSLFKSDLSRSNAASRSSRRSSCPSMLLDSHNASDQGSEQQQRRKSVTRARRLSVEPHPSLFIRDHMDEMNEELDLNNSDVDDEDEKLIQALAINMSSKDS